MERIPCCTVLVRIRRPEVNEEGVPLSIENVDKSEWEKDVWPKFESYRENFYYCTKYIVETEQEGELYKSRFTDLSNEEKISQDLKYLVKSFGEEKEDPNEDNVEDYEEFIDRVCSYDT